MSTDPNNTDSRFFSENLIMLLIKFAFALAAPKLA